MAVCANQFKIRIEQGLVVGVVPVFMNMQIRYMFPLNPDAALLATAFAHPTNYFSANCVAQHIPSILEYFA